MTQHWSAHDVSLEIREMPFYWRLSEAPRDVDNIPNRLPFRVRINDEFDYLVYEPTQTEWEVIDKAYKQNENIGFVNPHSGQINTYGSSVNRFFHKQVAAYLPMKIYEIGCGAGFSIKYLKERGWDVIGIDPSDYSLRWSQNLGFTLLKEFFTGELLDGDADFIFCNDVFEHVRNVEQFSRDVWQSLKPGGVFCFSTTNSTQSIEFGDVSMFEHQHVNMFTTRSIYLILTSAGFTDIKIGAGSYGNTFQVVARKGKGAAATVNIPAAVCKGYIQRAVSRLSSFDHFYDSVAGRCQFYVPLRCIPYLSAVGDFGNNDLFDSNEVWRGKFIDGYSKPIKSVVDLDATCNRSFFIGSMTFHQEIKTLLLKQGFREKNIFSIATIGMAS
jgi:SAM-dependent methyltransferase